MRFILFLVSLYFVSPLATAKTFISPFSSSVDSLNIPNSHLVIENKDKKIKIFRGMAPVLEGNIQSLKQTNVNKVLIIKKDSRGEVAKEIKDLKLAGYTKDQIHQIPIEWKNADPIKTCKQFVEALEQVIDFHANGTGNMYYHCTVGEDRTGILTALTNLWFSEVDNNDKSHQYFQTHMCMQGYGRGNPQKPFEKVVKPIRKNLTPIYAFLYDEIYRLKMQDTMLSAEICQKLSRPQILEKAKSEAKKYNCKKQKI